MCRSAMSAVFSPKEKFDLFVLAHYRFGEINNEYKFEVDNFK